jgi:hypothetical protein
MPEQPTPAGGPDPGPGARPIPRPIPAADAPAPEPPPHLRPRAPAPLRVLEIAPEGRPELVVLYKGTFHFEPGGRPVPAEEQEPLEAGGVRHDPLPGRETEVPSWKVLPELVGWKTGTDVVVQGSARPPRPVTAMEVAVNVAGRRVALAVTGRRVMDRMGERVVFSEAEPFHELPLRWEHAYGGRDPAFEAALLAGRAGEQAEAFRRARAPYEGIYGNAAPKPVEYPRNRYGAGWVLGGSDAVVAGRELPRIERIDDRLTPERAVVANLFRWGAQPLPGGFDYVDPAAFPRIAMLGLPPASAIPLDELPEVTRGLLPAGFCRGNVFSTPPERYAGLIHPLATRCAVDGLQLPFLRGDEELVLEGLDPAHARLRLGLPRARPDFTVPLPGRSPQELAGALLLVAVDADARRLRLIWAGRLALQAALPPGAAAEIEAEVHVRLREW